MNTYTRMLICLAAIAVLAVPSCAVPTPFMIYGWGSYNNGTDCDNLAVGITNPDNGMTWTAETSGNYYQISLSSGIDLNATDVLRFDATDGTSTSVTDHTVNQNEVDAGGFKYNITLETPSSHTTVYIGSTEGNVGDSVDVPINITDAPSIGAMDIRVVYNASILCATNIVNGSIIESLPAPLVEYHIGYVDINISFVTSPEAINGDGELFIVTFDVVGGNVGDSSPLNLEAEAYTTDMSPVALETVDGVVTVTGGAPDPAPSLVTYTISNTTISPNGDGIMDDTEIDVEFSESVDTVILIENATGVIKTLYTGSGVTDPDPQTWNGTDGSGNIVADGTYQVNVTMDDGANPMVYNNTCSIFTVAGGAEPQEPFLIDGYVWYENGTPCNNPSVSITNLNTSVEWVATTGMSSNNYQIMLTSGVDLNATEVLRFNATDGANFNVTDRVITTDEVNNGGLFDFNLTLESTEDPEPYLATYTISNTTISPNGDGIMDDTEIDVEFSESVTAAILIEDATGVIKTLYTGSGVTDPDPQTWNGTDGSGNIVADGTYQVNITMDDGTNPVVYDNTGSITVMTGPTTTLISIPDVSATGMITVPITIENVSNVGSCQLTLSYDPDVVMVSNASQSDFDSLFTNLENATSGSVSILAYQTSNPGLNGAVIVANVTFTAVGNGGSSTPLTLEVTTLTDATPNCNPIPYTVRDGSFTTFLNGDVNNDGVVDVADCMFLAKHLIGVSEFETITEAAADVNGNGAIEASDCMYLAKHLAGIVGFEVLK